MSDKSFGTPADALANASRVRPFMDGAYSELAVVAANASVATATGVATTGAGHYAFGCNSAFMIVFDTDSTITAPGDRQIYPAGTHHFYLTQTTSHFRITAASNGFVVWGKSSFGKE